MYPRENRSRFHSTYGALIGQTIRKHKPHWPFRVLIVINQTIFSTNLFHSQRRLSRESVTWLREISADGLCLIIVVIIISLRSNERFIERQCETVFIFTFRFRDTKLRYDTLNLQFYHLFTNSEYQNRAIQFSTNALFSKRTASCTDCVNRCQIAIVLRFFFFFKRLPSSYRYQCEFW